MEIRKYFLMNGEHPVFEHTIYRDGEEMDDIINGKAVPKLVFKSYGEKFVDKLEEITLEAYKAVVAKQQSDIMKERRDEREKTSMAFQSATEKLKKLNFSAEEIKALFGI